MLLQLGVNPLRVPPLQHKIARVLGQARTAPLTHTAPLTQMAPSQPHTNPATHMTPAQPHTAPLTHKVLAQPHTNPATHMTPAQPHTAPLTHKVLAQPHTNPATHTAPCPRQCPECHRTEQKEVAKQGTYRAVAQGNSHRSKKEKCYLSLIRARLFLYAMSQHRWIREPSLLAPPQRRSQMRAPPVVVVVVLQCASPVTWTSLNLVSVKEVLPLGQNSLGQQRSLQWKRTPR